MNKKIVSAKEAVADLRKLFGISDDYRNCGPILHEIGGIFYIDKDAFERQVVISRLSWYFKRNEIKDGVMRVDPTSLVFTRFEIVNLTK